MNHGSFGACPRVVLERQSQLRAEMEAQPVRFLHRELEARLDVARAALAHVVGCNADDLAFVPNATTGVNTVLRSLAFAPGDEILITDHGYNACRNVVDYVAEQSGARVVTAKLPFPVASEDQLLTAVLAAVTERTRLVLIDHVTSPTGIVLPVAAIVAALRERGIDTMVDGAHGPGMLPLDLDKLGAAYYTGNCHKWLCAPKGAALLHVRRDRQSQVRPSTISHGANDPRSGRSRFRLESDFLGTADYTAYLSVPTAIDFLRGLMPGGLPALREHNRRLVLRGRDVLCAALGIQKPVPDSCLGSLAAVPLPPATTAPDGPQALDPLHVALWEEHRIEVPVMTMARTRPLPDLRLLRVAGQAYNSPEQFEHLGKALKTIV
ncbi:MAG: aminotransferase class V-fold PLP-dependent enzyme [Planctomycetota bacterium]